MIVRQSTVQEFVLGPILDANGVAKTDEVVGSIRITKNDGTEIVAGGALVHKHSGLYKYTGVAGDVDSVGLVTISLNSGTNAMSPVRANVVEEKIFDRYFVSGADLTQNDDLLKIINKNVQL